MVPLTCWPPPPTALRGVCERSSAPRPRHRPSCLPPRARYRGRGWRLGPPLRLSARAASGRGGLAGVLGLAGADLAHRVEQVLVVGAHLRGELLLLLLHAHRVGVVLHARAVERVVELADLALVLLELLGLLRPRRVEAAQLLLRVADTLVGLLQLLGALLLQLLEEPLLALPAIVRQYVVR